MEIYNVELGPDMFTSCKWTKGSISSRQQVQLGFSSDPFQLGVVLELSPGYVQNSITAKL
jgi:hypothetical protein